jgi:outer membrane usher protein
MAAARKRLATGFAFLAITATATPRIASAQSSPAIIASSASNNTPDSLQSLLRSGIEANEIRIPLELFVNTVDHGTTLTLARGDDLLVSVDDLSGAGLRTASGTITEIGGTRYVSLRSLAPGIRFKIDQTQLVLTIDAQPAFFDASSLDVGASRRTRGTQAQFSPGAFLNYSITAGAPGPLDLTEFSELGIGTAAGLFSATTSYEPGAVRRGLIAFTHDDQATLVRATIGDEVAASGDLGGSVLTGGFGISRDFGLQPGFLRLPTPGLSGTVLTPTSAEIYVDGAYQQTVQLVPGPFTLGNLNVPTGSSVTRVVLHDAQGNTTTLSSSFYLASQALRKGVSDYEAHIGFERPNAFGTNDTYGRFATLGDYRAGVSDAVTLGVRGEATSGLVDGGVSSVFSTVFGEFGFDGSLSDASGVRGYAEVASYRYQLRSFGFGVQARRYGPTYANISLPVAEDRQTAGVTEFVSFPLTRHVNIALTNTTTTNRDTPGGTQTTAQLTAPIGAGASLSLDVERDRGSAGGFSISTTSERAHYAIGANLYIPLGRSSIVSLENQNVGGVASNSIELQKSVPNGTGFGYDARLSGGADRSTALSLVEKAPIARVEADVFSSHGETNATLNVAGSIVAIEDGLHLARPVESGYALVHVGGSPHVEVDFGGVPQGRTDGRGDVIVTDMTAYSENVVTAEDTRLGPDQIATVPSAIVVPRRQSGVVARLQVDSVRFFTGYVRVRSGVTIIVPSGGTITLAGSGPARSFDLGLRGELYLENLSAGRYRATITYSGTPCSFDLDVPAENDLRTDLGTLTCTL